MDMLARLEHLHEDVHLAQFIIRTLTNLENNMSDLTDKLDAALILLDDEASGVEALVGANSAASDILKGQLAAAQAGHAADQVELQKAIDALAAVNLKLAGPVAPAPVVAPVVPAPVVPAPVDVVPVPAPVVAPVVDPAPLPVVVSPPVDVPPVTPVNPPVTPAP